MIADGNILFITFRSNLLNSTAHKKEVNWKMREDKFNNFVS